MIMGLYRIATEVYRVLRLWIKDRFKFFPSLPTTINFDITYHCNSRCSMCNIWKHERANEFTLEELRKALSRRLFRKVEHVGLTGGEPSLRKDFFEIVDVLVESLPRLKSLSTITNCVSPSRSISIITYLYEKCKKAGIGFGLVLSMDGVESCHDRNRGVKGNYVSLMKVVDFVSNNKIPFSLGYTITKHSIPSIYETFEMARNHNWNIYFAIAEYIDRLNNQECEAIQSFTDDERYELQLFFHKLMNDSSIPAYYRRSYWKNFELLSGHARPIGCPYHKEGIVLSPELDVGHCAVKGKTVGNALSNNITSRFFLTWHRNKKYVGRFCDSCYHYHFQKSIKEEVTILKEKMVRKFVSTDNLEMIGVYSKFCTKPDINNFVLIVGWYGTETVGDKAILATVLKDYASKGYNLVVASIYPFITYRTLQELGIRATIIKSESKELIRYSKFAEKVIMGGGPLMGLYDLKYPLVSFSVSHLYKHENVVYGCGIGPVRTENYKNKIQCILALSDVVTLRDSDSVKLFKEWFPEKDVKQVEDPAIKFIKERSEAFQTTMKENVLACFLRKMPIEYSNEHDTNWWEERLAFYITLLAKRYGVNKVVLYSMHNFWVGNDDRQFARYFKKRYFCDLESDFQVEVDNSLSTVDNTIEKIRSARAVLCMRFHSMLFAHTLGADYKVIDYTRGGKIQAFLKDHDFLSHLVELSRINENEQP